MPGRQLADGIGTTSVRSTVPAQAPIRTCIGCRQRLIATELLRVVVVMETTELDDSLTVGTDDRSHQPVKVVPDPACRAVGRGAWLHPTMDCVVRAERRRAFVRALRVPGPINSEPVSQYVAELDPVTTSATPQELTSNGYSMKRQQ